MFINLSFYFITGHGKIQAVFPQTTPELFNVNLAHYTCKRGGGEHAGVERSSVSQRSSPCRARARARRGGASLGEARDQLGQARFGVAQDRHAIADQQRVELEVEQRADALPQARRVVHLGLRQER